MAKTKTIMVEGTTYTLKPLPPYCAPYLSGYVQLANKTFETFEQADKATNECKKMMDAMLRETVTPQPPAEHQGEVFTELMRYIAELVKVPDTFRGQPGTIEPIRGTRSPTSPTTM